MSVDDPGFLVVRISAWVRIRDYNTYIARETWEDALAGPYASREAHLCLLYLRSCDDVIRTSSFAGGQGICSCSRISAVPVR